MDLLVLAKEPVPGRVKTRLCPPCRPEEASHIAEAALSDTLDAAVASGADRVILSLEGRPGSWCPPGVVVVPQGEGTLADRLSRTWTYTSGPALQIGMDTPQVSAALLASAMTHLLEPDHDAVLGLADDGGWWAVGMRRPHHFAFSGIPTSQADTGFRQRDRLEDLGFAVAMLATLQDVDTWTAATEVAALAPDGAFAAAIQRVEARRSLEVSR